MSKLERAARKLNILTLISEGYNENLNKNYQLYVETLCRDILNRPKYSMYFNERASVLRIGTRDLLFSLIILMLRRDVDRPDPTLSLSSLQTHPYADFITTALNLHHKDGSLKSISDLKHDINDISDTLALLQAIYDEVTKCRSKENLINDYRAGSMIAIDGFSIKNNNSIQLENCRVISRRRKAVEVS